MRTVGLETGACERHETERTGVIDQRSGQSRLADAGFAAEQHGCAVTCARTLQHARAGVERRMPSDENRTYHTDFSGCQQRRRDSPEFLMRTPRMRRKQPIRDNYRCDPTRSAWQAGYAEPAVEPVAPSRHRAGIRQQEPDMSEPEVRPGRRRRDHGRGSRTRCVRNGTRGAREPGPAVMAVVDITADPAQQTETQRGGGDKHSRVRHGVRRAKLWHIRTDAGDRTVLRNRSEYFSRFTIRDAGIPVGILTAHCHDSGLFHRCARGRPRHGDDTDGTAARPTGLE